MRLRYVSVLMLFAGFMGWFAHTPPRAVSAASVNAEVQMEGSGTAAQLSLYNAAEHSIYVYQGVSGGGQSLRCSYRLHFNNPGGLLERSNCPIDGSH